jgi:cystathionine beta-lyase/cystathionine gamma-synthase
MNNLERSRADGGELRIQNSKLRIYAVADSIFDLIGGTPLLRLGELEGGCDGCAFASGLAAIDAITDLLDPGDHIVAGNDLYGGTHRLFNTITSRHGIGTTTADADDPEDFRRAMTARTRLVFVETPTNPMMRIVDLERIRAIASEHDALLVVDNTFLTPIYQRPLDIGADLVVHSTTKYLNGHSDGIGGVVVARAPELAERLHTVQNNAGAIMGPFDAYLVLRGLKTHSTPLASPSVRSNRGTRGCPDRILRAHHRR